MSKLLIDGDVLCYRAGFATDKSKYLVATQGEIVCDQDSTHCDDMKAAKEAQTKFGYPTYIWSRKETEPEDKALLLVDVMLGDIRARYPEHKQVVYLSGVGNFRHSIATRASYKGNRSGAAQPAHMKAIRQHLIAKHGAILSHGEEADDLLGIAMSVTKDNICVSIDKDLLQVPGVHYDFVKKEETTVSAKEAVINFYSQVISGDSTDNVIGATGYGPVKARKALEGCRNPFDCWQAALAVYVKEWGDITGPLYALECARLVFVRRKPGELWEAPTAPVKTKVAA